jgi:hypothetical protein
MPPSARRGLLPVSAFLDRFGHNVSPEPNSGCWLWTSTINQYGYGRVHLPGRRQPSAHRVAYEMDRGAIPNGLQIDHLCRVRCCCNPDHLEPVTAAENIRRAFRLSPRRFVFEDGFCINGHRLAEEVNYRHPRGSMICRKCKRLANLRAQKKSRAIRKQSRI